MRIRFGAALLALLVGVTGCDLDLANPNAPTEQEVLTDENGILALAVAMQSQYAGSVITYVRAPALVTDEWGTASRALLADQSLFTGVEVLADYGVVTGPYFVTYRIARSANLLIENAPQIERLSPATRTGLVALAKLFKAMALGSVALHYEEAAVDADIDGAEPQPRVVVLDTVIALLESARADLGTVADEDLTTFYDRAVGAGFDVRNTVDAMLARYYLITAGIQDDNPALYQQAIDAAARVDPNVLSLFTFPNPDINPIYNYAVAASYVAPLQSFVDEAEPGDQRPAFWVDVDAEPFQGNPTEIMLLPLELYSERNDPYPVYVPDEMKLIQAEAYTQLGDLPAARTLVNEVRVQCGTTLLVPAACLTALPDEALATEAELLEQIAHERRYELYEQGLRWEDMRRLGEYIEHEPSILFLPFPTAECQTQENPFAVCN